MKQNETFDLPAEVVENIMAGKDRILTADQAAVFVDHKLSWVYILCHRRQIPHYKHRGGAKLYFLQSELTRWMLGNRRRTVAEMEAEAQRNLAEADR